MFALAPLTLLFWCVLASRVFAFNITVGTQNLTTTQILDIPDSKVKTACADNCTAATTQIQACNDTSNCLCSSDTVAALLSCEQCMHTNLIALNKRMDFRVGSQPVLAGYAASCKAAGFSLATNQTALQFPSNWDGSFVAVLPVGGVAITIIVAVLMGVSGIFIVSSM